MRKFIKCKENDEVVNLDNVSYIYPSDKTKRIYFEYPAMNNEDSLTVTWTFPDTESYRRVLDLLDLHFVTEI